MAVESFVPDARTARAFSPQPICKFHFAIFNLKYDSRHGALNCQLTVLQIEK